MSIFFWVLLGLVAYLAATGWLRLLWMAVAMVGQVIWDAYREDGWKGVYETVVLAPIGLLRGE